MKVINEELNFELTQLIKDFNISSLPQIIVRVYPDQSTYHNAVLSPFAPTWQMGRIWHKSEIRMMAPGKIDLPDGVSVYKIYLHEIIHAIQWNGFGNPNDMPKWLWEGVASFKGCCAWTTLKDISNQFPGKLPGIKQINRNPELNYDFGYYLVQFIQEKWSWEHILELMREHGNIQKVLNISNREFHSEFEKWIELQK